jgi:hypothetical protein
MGEWCAALRTLGKAYGSGVRRYALDTLLEGSAERRYALDTFLEGSGVRRYALRRL